MKIIIPQTFENNFKKEFRLYHISIKDIIKALQQHPRIMLNDPYQKVKCYIKGIAIRGLVVIDHGYIVPLLITTKNNSQHGENLILSDDTLKKIDILQSQYDQDITNGNYTEY